MIFIEWHMMSFGITYPDEFTCDLVFWIINSLILDDHLPECQLLTTLMFPLMVFFVPCLSINHKILFLLKLKNYSHCLTFSVCVCLLLGYIKHTGSLLCLFLCLHKGKFTCFLQDWVLYLSIAGTSVPALHTFFWSKSTPK